ncbi:PREDICTED: endogenous retrovirus group K member 9 Pol protein-like, partial [Myotis brandtii]|uniref:endogenous retrovirus group K member 9 Pol protein-like n=1 Tax=Myotis brandtii TaxID=109478 RepID=UPI0007040948
FVSQAAPDIRRKLQKLDGFQGKSLSELVAVAQKVFDQREDPAKTTQELTQKMAKVLLAREEPPRKGAKSGSKKNWRKFQGPTALREPRLKLSVGGQLIDFLVDTGATHSVVQTPVGPTTARKIRVVGATGVAKSYPTSEGRITDLGRGLVTHPFLVIPECPDPLLGRDLLHKLRATITFDGGEEPRIEVGGKLLVTVPIGEEYLLYEKDPPTGGELLEKWKREIPGVWAETNPPGLAKEQAPIHVQLTSTAQPVRVRQYPMTIEARRGVRENVRKLKAAGILVPVQSPWNTPLLPVKKQETGEYRMVQDLREVNKRVETIHPTVPNPYTLLSLLPPDRTWYSVLDLKDAFFCLPLAPKSQLLFAFEWND